MSEHEITKEESLVSYRLDQLEKGYFELRNDLKNIMDVLNRLDKKMINIPENGLSCQIHSQLMSDMRKEIDAHQVLIQGLLSFKWRAIGWISAALLAVNLFGGAISSKLFPHESSPPIKIELIYPSTNHVASVK